MKKYQCYNHGYMYPDYFQGCGYCGTPYSHSVTGTGLTEVEAYEDALEQMSEILNGDIDELDLEDFALSLRDYDPNSRDHDHEGEGYFYISILF